MTNKQRKQFALFQNFQNKMIKIVFQIIFGIAIFTQCQSSKIFGETQKIAAEKAILQTMSAQESAWNRGEIDQYMIGYWPSDSLKFIGSRGLTYGFATTLANYKKSYPDRAAMGMLKFVLISVEILSPDAAHVVGKWALARPEKGDLSGHFTLLWRKIDKKWVIVADHSS
jgi:hypothetical protein